MISSSKLRKLYRKYEGLSFEIKLHLKSEENYCIKLNEKLLINSKIILVRLIDKKYIKIA